jgi:glutamine phosphoribosylpyrophosphate amidotransferase
MSTPDELIARKHITDILGATEEWIYNINQFIWSDSLRYLSVEDLAKVVWDIEITKVRVRWACMACLTWIYPTKWGTQKYWKLLV